MKYDMEKILERWREAGIRYFKPSEFDDPTDPGSGCLMNVAFVGTLDDIRKECGFPLRVNSGYRSPKRNKAVGGKTDSAHLNACAIDTACLDSEKRYKLIGAAYHHEIKRIGLAETFVHLDMSFDLPQGVFWLYPPKATPAKQKAKG